MDIKIKRYSDRKFFFCEDGIYLLLTSRGILTLEEDDLREEISHIVGIKESIIPGSIEEAFMSPNQKIKVTTYSVPENKFSILFNDLRTQLYLIVYRVSGDLFLPRIKKQIESLIRYRLSDHELALVGKACFEKTGEPSLIKDTLSFVRGTSLNKILNARFNYCDALEFNFNGSNRPTPEIIKKKMRLALGVKNSHRKGDVLIKNINPKKFVNLHKLQIPLAAVWDIGNFEGLVGFEGSEMKILSDFYIRPYLGGDFELEPLDIVEKTDTPIVISTEKNLLIVGDVPPQSDIQSSGSIEVLGNVVDSKIIAADDIKIHGRLKGVVSSVACSGYLIVQKVISSSVIARKVHISEGSIDAYVKGYNSIVSGHMNSGKFCSMGKIVFTDMVKPLPNLYTEKLEKKEGFVEALEDKKNEKYDELAELAEEEEKISYQSLLDEAIEARSKKISEKKRRVEIAMFEIDRDIEEYLKASSGCEYEVCHLGAKK